MDLFTRAQKAGPDEILIGLGAAEMRRMVGTSALLMLCAVVFWHGFQRYVEFGGGLGLILISAAGVFLGLRFWKSSATRLELTPTELRESGGRRLVLVDDIVAVDRGVFGVIKPTNGFVLVTRGKMAAAALPGIWWRLGNRIGVGGLTGAGEGKAMAELLEEIVKRREGKGGTNLMQELFKQKRDD